MVVQDEPVWRKSSGPIREFNNVECEFLFTYHPPTVSQQMAYESVTKGFLELAKHVAQLMPNGPGKTVAMRKLSEARMAVNAAIALEGRF